MTSGTMLGLDISTSTSRVAWPIEYWKTLIDSLFRKGAGHDPRPKYPDLAAVLEKLIELRDGRYFPKQGTPLAEHDDRKLSLLIIRRVPPGHESIVAGPCSFPSKTDWHTISVPFFATPGQSKYEVQSYLNRAAIEKQLLSRLVDAAKSGVLGLAFTLSATRKDRDLDNLLDGLAPVFNCHCTHVRTIGLLKLNPHLDATEVLALGCEARCLADASILPA